uniref:Uncharacterized protein n=1 Tax=Oryza rufipogon TaxID=4529 RepID=A0A0E0PBV9_ORYRU
MLQLLATTSTPLSPVKMRPAAAAMATKSEYRRMEAEEEEELDKEEWARRAEAQRRRRRSGGRYVFTCALFASLNAILLGYGQQPSRAKHIDISHLSRAPIGLGASAIDDQLRI